MSTLHTNDYAMCTIGQLGAPAFPTAIQHQLFCFEHQGMPAAEQKLSTQESRYGTLLIRLIFQSLYGYLVNRREGEYDGLGDFMQSWSTRWIDGKCTSGTLKAIQDEYGAVKIQ